MPPSRRTRKMCQATSTTATGNPPTGAAKGWKVYRQIKDFEEETRAQVETVLEKPQYKEFVKFRDEQRKRIKKALGI